MVFRGLRESYDVSDEGDGKEVTSHMTGDTKVVDGIRVKYRRLRTEFKGITGFITAEVFTSISFGIYFSCLTAVMNPLSKQFHFTDSKLGYITMAVEIGQIPFILITSYFGSRWHVPRVLGFTGCIYSLIAIIMIVPYFVFKHGKGADELGMTPIHGNMSNYSSHHLCNSSDVSKNSNVIRDMEFSDNFTYYLFISLNVILGAVGSPWGSLYMWYIDEHADKSKFPLLLGVINSATAIGPIIGTYLAAAVNSIYVDLQPTEMSPKDPMFIGAWWLGLLIGGVLCLITSPFLCCFPRTMKSDAEIKSFLKKAAEKNLTCRTSRESKLNTTHMTNSSQIVRDSNGEIERGNRGDLTSCEAKQETACSDDEDDDDCGSAERRKQYIRAMKDIYRPTNAPRFILRLLRNPVFIMMTIVEVALRYESGKGVFIFKFFTMQFNLADWEASAILGTQATISSVCSALSAFFGGFIVYRFKPTFSQATGFCVVLYSAMTVFTAGQIFLGCENFELYGLQEGSTKSVLQTACNVNCSCNTYAYKPICDSGITYFSPCHAGCDTFNASSTTTSKFYSDCSCTPSGSATDGACPKTCSSYYIYVCLEVIKAIVDGTSSSAMTLLLLRCVDPTEEALALGFQSFVASLLGFPVALLYGALIDTTCLVWQDTLRASSSRGVCWVFDFPLYRKRFWGVTIAFRLFEIAVEVVILFYTRNKDITMYDEDAEVKTSDQPMSLSGPSTDASDLHKDTSAGTQNETTTSL